MEKKSNMDGLATAAEYYDNYGVRARELREPGKKVIGYLTALGPVEILTAAGAIPLRLRGTPSQAITKADAHMETIAMSLPEEESRALIERVTEEVRQRVQSSEDKPRTMIVGDQIDGTSVADRG
jgi:benzoyl-CoA reductase/2-hydroxyglutaryl-CoA dehydratase subunit BcrC/BadD/HgdB